MKKTREEIAIHEAAHALYAHLFPSGKPFGVESVSIIPKPCTRRGKASLEYDTLGSVKILRCPGVNALANARELAEHYILLSLVGPAADFYRRGRQLWGRCEETEDDGNIKYLALNHGGWCTAEYLRWLRARAMVFVEAVQPAIGALTAVLLSKGEITGSEVAGVWKAHQSPLIPQSAIDAINKEG